MVLPAPFGPAMITTCGRGLCAMLTSTYDVSRASSCPDQRRLRLGQPEGHVHGAIQVDGGGQLGAGLLPLACLGIQRAKAPVAVGLERAHAEFVSQGEGLPVVGFGWCDLWGIAMLAISPRSRRARPGGPVLDGTGVRQGALAPVAGFLHAARQQIRLTRQTAGRLSQSRSRR